MKAAARSQAQEAAVELDLRQPLVRHLDNIARLQANAFREREARRAAQQRGLTFDQGDDGRALRTRCTGRNGNTCSGRDCHIV